MSSSAMTCAEAEGLAAELALGVLGGMQRSQVLAHLETCSGCRSLVDQLAAVSDVLLQLAPEVEPPAGFETRVLARTEPIAPLRAVHSLRSRRALWLASAGAAVAGVAAVLAFALPASSAFHVKNPGGVVALGGRSMVAAPLLHDGEQLGQVFAYAGNPSWVFMTVDAQTTPREVICELDLAGGQTIRLGTFPVSAGYHSLGSTVNVALS
ncbi:MAG: zf-HC2 domain-containing protein, partial [Acidimicrobiales bacterium]